MNRATRGLAPRLLWLAVAFAAAGTLIAAAIPLRMGPTTRGEKTVSFPVFGLLLILVLAVSAYSAGRGRWTVLLSALSTFVGVIVLTIEGFTLAYVCFGLSPGAAARAGCTGTFGAEWLAGASFICFAICPALSFLALIAGIVAAARRES